jgi:hypothetical protein
MSAITHAFAINQSQRKESVGKGGNAVALLLHDNIAG